MDESQLSDLMEVDLRGGVLVDLPQFDLSTPHAAWQFQPHCYLGFRDGDEEHPPHWYVIPEPPGDGWLARGLWTERNFRLEPNRCYVISALIRSDFAREDAEINLGLGPLDEMANAMKGRREVGVPSQTTGPNGWQRWDETFTTPARESVHLGRLTFYFYMSGKPSRPIDFRIADIKLVELPAAPFEAPAEPIEQVTFRGGPGNLPMAVEGVETGKHRIAVEVTGSRWVFDLRKGTIEAHQRIDFPRLLATHKLSASLKGLAVVRCDSEVVVLQNDHLAIGVQCDGMVALCPLESTSLTTTSAVAGRFVRYGDGHLFCTDGLGGFTVNPYVPRGSGKMPTSAPITPDLDFAGLARDDVQSLSQEPAGWKIGWDLLPGERVFLSAFPPRPYDWAEGFAGKWALVRRGSWTEETYDAPFMSQADVYLLWNFHIRQWAMSFGLDYLPRSSQDIHDHVAMIHERGKKAVFYSSGWFHATRDPEAFVTAIRHQIDEYGFDGMYSDGLPAIDWLVGYEEMRLLRELIPDGPIIVHDSLPQSGRHPAAFPPWIYTYASSMYMAEGLPSDEGVDWSWARYVISQWRVSNAVGAIKGDRWNDPEAEERIDVFVDGLIWNSRRGELSMSGQLEKHIPALYQLKNLWEQHGSDPHFYDRYYVEEARAVSGATAGPTAMPIVAVSGAGDGRYLVALTCRTAGAAIHYTTDGSTPTTRSKAYGDPVTLRAGQALRAVAVAEGLEVSPPATYTAPW